ncbi:hypothetical protein ACFL4O_02515, partial [bacterium]
MLKKTISFILAGIFLIQTAYTSQHVKQPIINTQNTMFLPSHTGKIIDTYKGDSAKPHLSIIYDVHCNYSVQSSIKNLIGFLKNNYNKKLEVIQIEGSAGFINTGILKNIPNNQVKECLTNTLMMNGYISGAEAYDIFNPRKIKIYGVEDSKVHSINIMQLKKGLP